MRLRALQIERLPGIDAPFGLTERELGEGLHVVHGPNGIGKSSLVRALRALLWPELVAGHAVTVEARFELDGTTWSARRDGRDVRWQRDGASSAPPPLPEAHLAHCWAIGLEDLEADGDDAWFAERVRLAMSDEYDLRGTARALFTMTPRHGFTQEDQLRQRRVELSALEAEQERLLEAERGLAELDERVADADRAGREVLALEAALARAKRAGERRSVELQLAAFPPGMAQLPPEPAAQLEELDGEIDAQAARVLAREKESAKLQQELAATRLERPLPGSEIAPWRARIDALAELERELRDVERDLADCEARRAASVEVQPERLASQERATAALRTWIATPEQGPASAASWIALALLAAAGALAGVWLHPAAWLFSLAAVVLAVLQARRGARSSPRTAWREAFERERLDPPAQWSEAAVALRLSELERELSEARAASAGARQDVAGVRARRETIEGQRDHLADELCAWLSRVGEEPAPGASALREALSALERRSQDCARALEGLRRTRAELEERGASLQALRAKRSRLLSTVGLDETRRDEFTALVERHAGWKALADRAAALAAQGDEDEPDLELDRLEPEELRARLEDARGRAAQHAALLEAGAQLRGELRAAGQRATYEDARAAELRAREELEQRLDEALDALAGRALLAEVEREHASSARPEVLREASELLRAFTGGRYGLDVVEHEGRARLRALDARQTGRSLSPGELSDGTRAQLLLAARLSFARRHERGAGLPLFLDDALATSDATRTRAVAESLAALCARDGRQVFVLLRDAGDARLVTEADPAGDARAIDLAALRARGAPALDRERLALPERREVPVYAGLEPERWAELLGVEPLDPFRSVESEHVYWLAPDRPELVHRLLQARAERWGVVLGLIEAGVDLGIEDADLARLESSAQVYEAVRRGWRVGRGRRVEREALVQAGVSDKYLEGLTELAREQRGDARALIAALEAPGDRRDERVKGFHAKVLERVVESLTASGHIDPREPLDEPSAWARLLADVQAAGESDLVELRRRFEFLRARFDEVLPA